MGDTRIRYGMAYGRQNNFYTGSTDQTTRGYLAGSDGCFKQADTTPDVTNGVLFYTNNSAATTITHFDLSHPSTALVGSNSTNLAGLFEGKVIKIFFLDTATTLSNSTRLVLSDSANHTYNLNSIAEFIYHTSSWYEMCRNEVIPVGASASRALSVAATNLAITVTPADDILVVTGTIATTTITGVSGGYIGQTITILQGSGGASLIVSNTGSAVGVGNIYFMGTDAFRIGGISSANNINNVTLKKISADYWTILNAEIPR